MDISQLAFYKNFKKVLLLRLVIVGGITLFWTIKSIISPDYSHDKSFLILFIIFSNLFVGISLLVTFSIAKKRSGTYQTGDIQVRFRNYLGATMYRHSVLEISPVFIMVGFVFFGKIYFLLEAVAFMILYAFYFPTAKKLANSLNVDSEDVLLTVEE
jgi:hypothetical protein